MKIVRRPLGIGSAPISKNSFIQGSLHADLPGLWEKFLAGDSSALSAKYRCHVPELHNFGLLFTQEDYTINTKNVHITSGKEVRVE